MASHSQTSTHSVDEMRLAGAELAGQRHNIAALQQGCK
jgi:hypothetical protein